MAKNVRIVVEDRGDPKKDLEAALRKFNKQLTAEAVLDTYREKERFEKPSTKKHRKEVYRKHLQKFVKSEEIVDRK